MASKRVFVRRGAYLADEYIDPGGRRVVDFALLAADPNGPTGEAADARVEVAKWLSAARAGDGSVASFLAGVADYPGVRSTLVRAAEESPLEALGVWANALGRTGGIGSKRVLREGMRRLLEAPDIFLSTSHGTVMAESLVVVAGGLLNLDADSTSAATAISRVLHHPSERARQRAAHQASIAYRRASTRAMLTLRAALLAILDGSDDAEFLFASGALTRLRPKETVTRLERLLGSDQNRAMALDGLLYCVSKGDTIQAVSVLRDELWRDRMSLREAVQIVRAAPSVTSATMAARIARAAMSSDAPSVRLLGLRMLSVLPIEIARRLIGRKIVEPDETLRGIIEVTRLSLGEEPGRRRS